MGVCHLRSFVDSKFSHSVFPSSVVGLIFACLCDVQLRLGNETTCFD